jgi:fibronectin type 3 domain-containing protein
VLAFPLGGCAFTPQFLACLLSGAGTTEECKTDTVAPGAPAPPAGVTAEVSSVGLDAALVTVDWTESPEPDAFKYRVYRATTPGGPYELRGDALATFFVEIFDPAPCLTYYYVVTAVDRIDLESQFSAEVPATLGPSTCGPPDVPAGLDASVALGAVELDWLSNLDTDLLGYNVYRAAAAAGPFTKLNPSPVTASAYVDEEPPPGADLFYYVTAVDTEGLESGPSETVLARLAGDDPPPDRPTGLTATSGPFRVDLNWDSNEEGDLAGYNVYRALSPAGPFGKLNTLLVIPSEYTVFDEFPIGTEFFFYVTAVDVAGNESNPSDVVSAVQCGASGCLMGLRFGLSAPRGKRDVKPFEFKLTLSGELSRPGPSRLVAGIIGGEGFEFEGPFELKASSAGKRTTFTGDWRSKTALRLDPATGTLTATGGDLHRWRRGLSGVRADVRRRAPREQGTAQRHRHVHAPRRQRRCGAAVRSGRLPHQGGEGRRPHVPGQEPPGRRGPRHAGRMPGADGQLALNPSARCGFGTALLSSVTCGWL